jgi:hypothetical protein
MANPQIVMSAPLPTTFRGKPQDFFEAIIARLQLLGLPTGFNTDSTMPTSNQGPWLKGGKEIWVWDETATPPTYVPQSLSFLNQQVFVGDNAPDPTVYQLWLKTSGSTLVSWNFYFGDIIGWVGFPSVLANGVITHEMLQDNCVYRNNIAPGEVTIDKLQANLPLSKFVLGQANQVIRMSTDGTVLSYGPVDVNSGNLSPTIGAWTTWAHTLGVVPARIRVVMVCTTAVNGWAVGAEYEVPRYQGSGTSVVFNVGADATNVYLWLSVAPAYDTNPTSGVVSTGTYDTAHWKMKIYAGV